MNIVIKRIKIAFFSYWIFLALVVLPLPKLSLITYCAPEDPINDFLREMSNQPIFMESELIVILINASQDEISLLQHYEYIFPQIHHIIGSTNQTVSALLNQAIKKASSNYISILCVEDFHSHELFQTQLEALESHATIDVVYTDYYVSYSKNTPIDYADNWYLVTLPEFSCQILYQDIPGPHAVWRKALHEKHGYFDEAFLFHYNWEFWNRCVCSGALFKKVSGNSATHFFNYHNQKKILHSPQDYEISYTEEKTIRDTYSHLWQPKITEKSFVIITASYKNKDWYKRNLDSLLNQNYTNYRIIYIDDNSSDQTGKLVQEYAHSLNKQHLIEVVINDHNIGALANIYKAIHSCAKHEIIVIVDGDDWLAHNNVLSYLNTIYQNPDVWLTYGQFQWFPAGMPGCATLLPEWVIQKSAIREYMWVTTHLRTFYAGLFHLINKEDLWYEGKFCPMTWDLAIMFPMVEMAATHIRFIEEVLYIYNTANSINDNKVNLALQDAINQSLRQRKRYKPLTQF